MHQNAAPLRKKPLIDEFGMEQFQNSMKIIYKEKWPTFPSGFKDFYFERWTCCAGILAGHNDY